MNVINIPVMKVGNVAFSQSKIELSENAKSESSKPICPISFIDVSNLPDIDTWEPDEEDQIFRDNKGMISCDIASFYGYDDKNPLNIFDMTKKRSYNNEDMRKHTCKYLNYFEKYIDLDKKLLFFYRAIKYMIDINPAYNKSSFIKDLYKYVISRDSEIHKLITIMNNRCYSLNLTYKNNKNPNLQYSDWSNTVTLIWKHSRKNFFNCWEILRPICYKGRRKGRQALIETKVRKK